jgi:hypothetical protein
MIRLSFATSLLLGTALYATAADDLASAFKEGSLDGRIRTQYFNTNWIDNDGWAVPNKPNLDSEAMAVGGSLIYKTAPLYGISAGVGFYTTHDAGILTNDNNGLIAGHPKNTTASDLFSRGPGAAKNFSTGYSVLAESYLEYNIEKTNIKAGRFLMSNPWITSNDTKMIPIAIQGGEVVSTDISNMTIQIDYADKIKERGMDYFGSMADTSDTPDAIKNYYKTHYTVNTEAPSGALITDQPFYGQASAPAVIILGVKNRSIDSLEVQAWGMHWDNIVDQGMLEANYAVEAGDATISFGARYIQQFDRGAGAIITPKDGSSIYATGAVTSTTPLGTVSRVQLKGDNDNSIDTYLYAFRAVALYGPSKLSLAFSHTNSSGDLIAPWRGFPTSDYTRSMTITDWNANTHSYKAQFNYDFNAHVTGLSAFISYSYYDRDPSKVPYQTSTNRYFNNGDTHQWNIDTLYVVESLKGLELKARFMIQDNQTLSLANSTAIGNSGAQSQGYGNDTSNRELRLETNYRF